jgi:hypothetical protein
MKKVRQWAKREKMGLLRLLIPGYAVLEMKCAALQEQINQISLQRDMAEARCEDIRRVADAAWLSLTGRSIFGMASERLPMPEIEQTEPVYSPIRTTRSVQAEAQQAAMANLEKFFDSELA